MKKKYRKEDENIDEFQQVKWQPERCTLVLWVRTWKKTVANDRDGIKHLTLKFRGSVGQGGMNKWWKNELLKEHWPKSWMCSSHVVMVCYCCWNRQEESVKKRVGLSCSKKVRKRGRKNVTPPFVLPGEFIQSEWHESFSLDKIYKLKPQRQDDSCTK